MSNGHRRCRPHWPLLLGGLLALALRVSPVGAAEPLRVAAAADLRAVLTELGAGFVRQQPGSPIEPIFGASGKLAAQIEHGAPFDVLLAADERYPARLHQLGLSRGEPRRYARGRLTLWIPARSPPASLAALPGSLTGKLALANPLHAPYGQRAREALQAAGVWDALQDRIVYGENVAQATQLVVSGAAEAGLISHALLPAQQTAHALVIDARLHAPLWQAAVVLRRSSQGARGTAFIDYLRGAEGQAALAAAGFEAIDAASP